MVNWIELLFLYLENYIIYTLTRSNYYYLKNYDTNYSKSNRPASNLPLIIVFERMKIISHKPLK